MTDPSGGELTPPFVQRLRDDLLGALPRHRRRRRHRRRLALGTATVALVTVVALAGGAGLDGDGRDRRPADVAIGDAGPVEDPSGIAEGPVLPSEQPALDLVDGFVRDLRRGDLEAAAERWSGYPRLDDLASRVAEVEQLRDELPWLADPAGEPVLEAPIWSGLYQVVTVTEAAGAPAGPPRRAAAFVVDRAAPGAEPTIQRLPSPSPASTPPTGTTVARGQEIVVPVQGAEAIGVAAWFGGLEVPVRHADGGEVVRVRVPDTVIGDTVLTVLVPTPEVPAAYGFWFPVE